MSDTPGDVVRLGDRRPALASLDPAVDPVHGLSMVGCRGSTDVEAVRNLIDMLVDDYADGDGGRVSIVTITFGTEPDGGRAIAYGTYAVDPPPLRTGDG